MKKKWSVKIISMLLVIATLMVSLPLAVFANEVQGTAAAEVYVKSIKMAQAKTKEEAKALLEMEGYTFLDHNLNEGAVGYGVWLGYTTTTDPTKAIYDIKLMNAKGGYTLTSMKDALEAQKTSFTQMAEELNYLVKEFVEAYAAGSVPAQKAYKALNFFRVVDGETEYPETNGLGYQFVNGKMSIDKLTEMLLFCDATILDTVVKTLTMGIQLRSGNWLDDLSALGPYDSEKTYAANETELKQRAKQLLVILQLYAQSYNAMEAVGVFKEFDEKKQGNTQGDNKQEGSETTQTNATAEQKDLATVDMARAAIYKVLFDDLATYKYGTGTLKDFFLSLANGGSEKALFPLVSVLTDGEFAAMSYGCVLEMISGASAKISDFNDYDDSFADVTKDAKPIYLYMGVNSALLNDDTIVGFTDEASRNMALTGEYQFYERETTGENVLATGRNVAWAIQGIGGLMVGAAKGAMAYMSLTGSLAALTATNATGILAGFAKVCAFIGGSAFALIVTAAALIVAVYAYIRYLIDEYQNSHLDWDKYPIPEYMYDIQEVGFTSTSLNDGIATEYMKKTSYVFYEVVRSVSDKPMDLNAFSSDASQWIAMYVSYDRPGDTSKPIKANNFKVSLGNGETPDGYTAVSRFGEAHAYNLNQWENDRGNGVFMFYQQDKTTYVKSDRTYYISNVILQTGESAAHCISLLERAQYIPLNVNLSPNHRIYGFPKDRDIFTYLGYKLTDNPTEAITDIRIEYNTTQTTVQLGSVTYASCGTSAGVTLYATKYKSAGTPILAGSLICVNDREDAPAGYEPVNFLSGGPAQSFSLYSNGIASWMDRYYIYFLPQTTFTSGTSYLGGLTYYRCDNFRYPKSMLNDDKKNHEAVLKYLKKKTGNDYPISTQEECLRALNDYAIFSLGYTAYESNDSSDNILYYATYNPYRAIYDVKGTAVESTPKNIVFESQGYYLWSTTSWEIVEYPAIQAIDMNLLYGDYLAHSPLEMSAKVYLSGNPSKDNIYVKSSEAEDGMMSETQPIRMSDIIHLKAEEKIDAIGGENSDYRILTDYFTSSATVLNVKSNKGTNTFNLYVVKETVDKPYISSIAMVDSLSIYRGLGGADSGINRSNITDGMMFARLAAQGATRFVDFTSKMYAKPSFFDFFTLIGEFNTIRFGYTKTADVDQALRDVFIYFGGFSTDKPPYEIYRGDVRYRVICEIPYNLTGYEGAPRPVLYLYGTTDSRAGSPITDIDFTGMPFKDGYSAVRTQSGRSMWSELIDYTNEQQAGHFMSGAKELLNKLFAYFSPDIRGGESIDSEDDQSYDWFNWKNQIFYIQIKHEQESDKPYISELYLRNKDFIYGTRFKVHGGGMGNFGASERAVLDNLFDQGAEGFVDVDLNLYHKMMYREDQRIFLGYSRTANPDEAITAIRAAHDGIALKTRNVNGVIYNLVRNLNLNDKVDGDSIYLYYTKSKNPDIGSPISDIIPTINTAPSYYTTDSAEVLPVMRWDSWKPSDMNAGTGRTAVYLSVVRPFERPYGIEVPAPNYGKEQVYTRRIPSGKVQGKYIAALYVMDKNTLRQEKLAKGVASNQCTCDKITDQEVFDRLTAMGATTIINTPINLTGGEYGKTNPNKVFIGYSRTDNFEAAIKHIAIQTDVLSLSEPPETKTIKGIGYDLVAQNAKKVTTLPRAINLIGVQDGQDLLAPKMYLYTSKEGKTEPIRDIVIDKSPLRDGWVTALSETGINPFGDIYEEALKHAQLGEKDYSKAAGNETVYAYQLYKWMNSVADMFDPEDDNLSPFYIHYKRYDGNSIEDALPYIGKIYLAYGDSQQEALAKLIAYEPDGFVDYDLNRNAGYPFIYLAYKRTASRSDAIKSLAVFVGKNPADSKKLNVGEGARFDLVSNVDLNTGVGGSYLYLYATTSSEAGEPIRGLRVSNDVVYKSGNGIMESTVMIAENSAFTKDAADLNRNVGFWSDYIYLVMKRDAPSSNVGALIATGSWIAIGVLASAGIAFAMIVFIKKKRKSGIS